MTITLFVGDCNEDLSIEAKKFDKTACLVDSSNFEKYLLTPRIFATFYTSAADLPKISQTKCVFYEILNFADNIYYRPPVTWSDGTSEFTLQNQQQLTEYFLYLIHQQKNNVDGLNLSAYTSTPYLSLQSQRSSDDPQLWTAGCSVTAGVGVSTDERYTTVISQNFDDKFLDLSKGGSSIEFSADQILRSDIRRGDTVVWGLTSEYRAPYWSRAEKQCLTINHHTFDYKRTNRADDITDETRLYKAVTEVNQVENFCKKIGAKLVAVPIICSEVLQLLLSNNRCYYQLPYQSHYIDLGTDNLHPGPRQHQWYADHINEIIKGLK